MLGTLSVGKTSLVRRFVDNVFSEKYQTTIGVKVDRKVVSVNQQHVSMMLWDIEGADRFNALQLRYLRGAEGCIIVSDGTRPGSLEQAFDTFKIIRKQLPNVPVSFVINKYDLAEEWALDACTLADVNRHCGSLILTSAKTGVNVEYMFGQLASQMLTDRLDVSVA